MAAHILVIDDDKTVLSACCELLKSRGFLTTPLTNAKEALKRIRKTKFDLILTDLVLPNMDAIALLKNLKINSAPLPPVIVMSGYGSIESAVEACRLGAANFIEKPFDAERLLWAVEDALKRRALESDLTYYKELTRIKHEFLSMVSHELKVPLMGIESSLELLRNHFKKSSPTLNKLLAIMRRNSRQLFWLIQNMLSLAREEAKELTCLPKRFLLRPLVKSALIECLLVCEENKTLKFTLDIPQDLFVWADRKLVFLVFVNLIHNAIKFSPPRKRVGISAQTLNGKIKITVWDQGIGIAKRDLEKLFEPFSQVDSSISRKFAGSGLGLSIVKTIVSKHGGHVWIGSEPGRGTHVSFTLSGVSCVKQPSPKNPALRQKILAGIK